MKPRSAVRRTAHSTPAGRTAQRGVALLLVLIMALLGTLLAAWSSRTALFSERITGNDADYQRALQAAQAMVRDAELDIRGQQVDGTPCRSGPDYDGSCRLTRLDVDAGQVFFPQDAADFAALKASLGSRVPPCVKGICVGSKVASEFWLKRDGADGFGKMKAAAAHYGEFTGAVNTGKTGDPLLAPALDKAWYWVEVLPYDMGPGLPAKFRPDSERPFIYRITGIAEGLKANSLAVVQTLFIWRRDDA